MNRRSSRNRRFALCGGLVLKRGARESLQNQLVRYFREAIASGRLKSGSRIPSSRQLASEHGISRITAVEAYERLIAEGYLCARARAGLFVREDFPESFLLPARTDHVRTDGGEGLRRLPAPDRGFALTPGVPALDHFPWSIWSKLATRILREQPARAVGWPDPRGESPLRQAIAEYLGAARGISCAPDQVIVSSGSQSLMEMLARALTSPGDRVWFEEPGDPASRAVLMSLGLEPVAVPVDEDGLDVQAGRLAAPAARLAVVAPSHHYPLGISMSLARRRELLEWAAGAGAWIVENEIDGDYRFVTRTRAPLHTLDADGRVIYLGSFNKPLAPGLRIGYAVVPAAMVESLTVYSPAVSVHNQLLLARFWAEGHLGSHLRCLREVHARRREILTRALREHAGLLQVDEPPEAGLRLAVRLAPEVPDREVVRACLTAGLKLGRPLSACYSGQSKERGLTLGFASTPEDAIAPAVHKLAAAVRAARPGSASRF